MPHQSTKLGETSSSPAPTAEAVSADAHPRIGAAMLPTDLDGSMRALDDEAFERLSKAVEQEARRRMLRHAPQPPSAPTKPLEKSEKATSVPSKASVIQGLTPAKARLIRAAAKAGLKPSAMVREFGVTIAMVRAVLSET